MKKTSAKTQSRIYKAVLFALSFIMVFAFSSPAFAGNGVSVRDGNTAVIYGIIAGLSLLLLLGYCFLVRKKTRWMQLLYICVFIVNLGYFLLATSNTLNAALRGNCIAYFGSVFLPLCMLMIILDVCGIKLRKPIVCILIGVSILTFLLAASGGYSDLYYKEVTLELVDGVASLHKVYGPLHFVYLVYLLSYFGAMIATILYIVFKKKFSNSKYAVILASMVFGNIAIWMVEQTIDWNFEFLSISYIVTELLLLMLHDMLRDYNLLEQHNTGVLAGDAHSEENALPTDIEELFNDFASRVQTLTPTERTILQYYIEGDSLNDIAAKAYISINTAKKHNTNLNKKLGIGSREELQLYIELFRRGNRLDEISYMK